MNNNIKDIDKLAEEVLNNQELRDAINDKIMEKNLENLKLSFAHEKGQKER